MLRPRRFLLAGIALLAAFPALRPAPAAPEAGARLVVRLARPPSVGGAEIELWRMPDDRAFREQRTLTVDPSPIAELLLHGSPALRKTFSPGTSTWEGIPPGDYRVVVATEAGRFVSYSFDLRSRGGTRFLPLLMPAMDFIVRGRLVPPPEGTVAFVADLVDSRFVKVDDEGRFALPKFSPAHPTELFYVEPGRLAVRLSGPSAARSLVDGEFPLPAPREVVAGIRAEPGARVVVLPAFEPPEQEWVALSRVAADGTFVGRSLSETAHVVVIGDSWTCRTVADGGAEEIEFRDGPPSGVAGVVRSRSGSPVPDTPVYLLAERKGGCRRCPEWLVRTLRSGADGGYEIPAPWAGRVSAAAWSEFVTPDVAAPEEHPWSPAIAVPAGGIGRIDPVVVPASWAEVQVVTARGAPVPNVLVETYGGPSRPLVHRRELDPTDVPHVADVTDAAGRCRLGGLLPGRTYEFSSDGGPLRRVESGEIELAPQGTKVLLRALEDARVLVRIVDDATGAPVGGASIRLDSYPNGWWTFRDWRCSDRDGRCELMLPVGEKGEAVVRARGYVRARAPVPPPVPGADVGSEIVIRLDAGSVIAGVVRLPNGDPARRVAVACGEGLVALTDDSGAFTGRVSLSGGPARLTVRSSIDGAIHEGAVLVESPSTDLVIDLTRIELPRPR